MGVITTILKTHSRQNVTNTFDNLNDCIIHKCKPVIMDIVAGRSKEHHFVASCKDEDCNKISMDSGKEVVNIWNKWNPQ